MVCFIIIIIFVVIIMITIVVFIIFMIINNNNNNNNLCNYFNRGLDLMWISWTKDMGSLESEWCNSIQRHHL